MRFHDHVCFDVGQGLTSRRAVLVFWMTEYRVIEFRHGVPRHETARNAETHNLPSYFRMRVIGRDLIRGGHYGQRSCESRKQCDTSQLCDRAIIAGLVAVLERRRNDLRHLMNGCARPQSIVASGQMQEVRQQR